MVRKLFFLLAAALSLRAPAGEIAPLKTPVDVEAVLARLVARASAISSNTNTPPYVFRKVSISDTLSGDGSVKRTKEKVYEVTIVHGMTQNRLLSVDGRLLDVQESDALTEREERTREAYSGARAAPGGKTERMDQIINAGLIERFEFTPVGRESLRGRSCLVLAFKPRSGPLPDDRLMDRVLNLFRGRIWIDESEDEVVKADVATEGPLRVWGGVLGSLERFQLLVERERSAFGVWYNRYSEVSVRARKLFTSFGMRVRELGSDIRPGS